jgi:GTP-binding protein YchF
MGFSCGIVGLPNVGKSTLFNALTATAAAESANYPFTTIEPNVGRVAVPDPRLDEIAGLARSAKVIPTFLEFVDIAGLVRGASRGEGLGNKFLAHIREVDCIAHVLRCFENEDITHVDGRIDPLADAETIETELQLADLDTLERRRDAAAKKARTGERDAKRELAAVETALAALAEGRPIRSLALDEDATAALSTLSLLTAKPMLYVCNVDEAAAASGNAFTGKVAAFAAAQGAVAVVISAALEAEVAAFDDPAERAAYLAESGLEETGLARLIRAGYGTLGLITFFTAGPKETRAWTVPGGATAPQAAGRIHTDFERGFIRAETIAYADYVAGGGEQGAREAGKMRSEGKDYVVADGDVMLFRFNV